VRALCRDLLIVCFAGLAFGQLGWAVDHVEEFSKARKTLQQQVRSKQPSDRIEALKRLEEFPIADAVRMIHNAHTDADSSVREAAYDTLLRMNGNQEVCQTLLLMAKKAVQRKDGGLAAAPLMAILLSSNLSSAQRDAIDLLEKSAVGSKVGVQIALTLADELGNHHEQSDVLPLARLSKSRIFSQHFGVRRAVIHALTLIQHADAIGALVDIANRISGEAQADAVEHLADVTGQIFGMEGAAWQRWWDDSKETFVYPARSVQTPYRSVAMSNSGSYYGMPIFAERLVFVLDTSGSMTGPKIDAAKRELIKALSGLSDHVQFGIVVFNGTVTTWQKQLVPATEKSKHAAILYVASQTTHSNTASYDALETAFGFDTEAIYFLSDGAPHGGKITAPVDIVAAVTAANRLRRISIYTIGIDVGFAGSPLETFLQALAAQNLGLFRRVDQ
jgi:HEAT repeat protein